ncbi:MAG: DUF6263 family protein [Kiritimatiellia bacterium]
MKMLFLTPALFLPLLLTPAATLAAENRGRTRRQADRRRIRAAPRTPPGSQGRPDGRHEHSMTMKMSTAMNMADRKMPAVKSPPIAMKMDIKIDSVDAAGDIHYTARFTEAGVSTDDPAQAAMASIINQSLAGLKDMTITAAVSNQGHIRSATTSGLDKLSPAMKQQMGGIENQLGQMSAPLPDEAVGVGGSWEVTQHMTMNGLEIDQVCVYEIAAITGSRVDLKISLKQSAPEQAMKNEALPPGTTLKVLKLASTGEGTATFDLTRVASAASQTRVHSVTDMEVNAGGRRQVMSTDMNMDMDMRSEPAKP